MIPKQPFEIPVQKLSKKITNIQINKNINYYPLTMKHNILTNNRPLNEFLLTKVKSILIM